MSGPHRVGCPCAVCADARQKEQIRRLERQCDYLEAVCQQIAAERDTAVRQLEAIRAGIR